MPSPKGKIIHAEDARSGSPQQRVRTHWYRELSREPRACLTTENDGDALYDGSQSAGLPC